jgi:tetratricopeptide (TPR) repeat protein
VSERVAFALLLKGLSLGELGRREEEVVVYESLIDRYRESADPATVRHVAWAFNNRAFTLKELRRTERSIAAYDELIARFSESREPEIRRRVSWALWNKAGQLGELSRDHEVPALYEQLIARHDEGLNAELDRNIAWCMADRASKLGRSGDAKEQMRLCDDLVARFAESDDPNVVGQVLFALQSKASTFDQLGQHHAELATYEQITERLAEAKDAELLDRVAASLCGKAYTLAALERTEDALGAYDEALALLVARSEPQLRARSIDVLFRKGARLGNSDRRIESLVMYDSVVSAYREGQWPETDADEPLGTVVLALLHKVEALCWLDRTDEAGAVGDELAAVLGGASTPGSNTPAPTRQDPSEERLAAAFAAVFNSGECWSWFSDQTTNPPVDLMAERALELYHLTEPFLAQSPDRWDFVVQFAMGALRDIADGYAMLTRSWSVSDRAALPLPEEAEQQRGQLIERFGIADWAAESGHPLESSASAHAADNAEGDADRLEEQRTEREESTPSFLRHVQAAVFNYTLLAVLCDSQRGRELLNTNEGLRLRAPQLIRNARTWLRWLGPNQEETAGLSMGWLLIAQGWFLATRDAIQSSAELFPSRRTLRDLVC